MTLATLDILDATALENYRQLALSIAAGGTPLPAEIERVLRESGKSRADLRAAVNTLAARRASAEGLERAAALDADAERLDKEHAELLAAHREYTANVEADLRARWLRVQAAFDQKRQAHLSAADLRACGDREKLYATASAAITARLQSLAVAASQARVTINSCKDRLSRLRSVTKTDEKISTRTEPYLAQEKERITEALALVEESGGGNQAQSLRDQLRTVETLLNRFAEIHAEARAAEEEFARVESEREAATAEALEWQNCDIV